MTSLPCDVNNIIMVVWYTSPPRTQVNYNPVSASMWHNLPGIQGNPYHFTAHFWAKILCLHTCSLRPNLTCYLDCPNQLYRYNYQAFIASIVWPELITHLLFFLEFVNKPHYALLWVEQLGVVGQGSTDSPCWETSLEMVRCSLGDSTTHWCGDNWIQDTNCLSFSPPEGLWITSLYALVQRT